MSDDKQVNVKVSRDNFGMLVFAFIIGWFLFRGDPNIAEYLRQILGHMAAKP